MIKFDMDEFLNEFEDAFERVKKLKIICLREMPGVDLSSPDPFISYTIREEHRKTRNFIGMNNEIATRAEEFGYFTYEDCIMWAENCYLAGAISAMTALYEYGFSNMPDRIRNKYFSGHLDIAIKIYKMVEKFYFGDIINDIVLLMHSLDLSKYGLDFVNENRYKIEAKDLDCWLPVETRRKIIEEREKNKI